MWKSSVIVQSHLHKSKSESRLHKITYACLINLDGLLELGKLLLRAFHSTLAC